MMIGSYHKNLLISFLVSSCFFHSHVQKKKKISSGWIWVEFGCSLSPQSFTGKKWIHFEGFFSLPENLVWRGAGLLGLAHG